MFTHEDGFHTGQKTGDFESFLGGLRACFRKFGGRKLEDLYFCCFCFLVVTESWAGRQVFEGLVQVRVVLLFFQKIFG